MIKFNCVKLYDKSTKVKQKATFLLCFCSRFEASSRVEPVVLISSTSITFVSLKFLNLKFRGFAFLKALDFEEYVISFCACSFVNIGFMLYVFKELFKIAVWE